MVDHKLNQISLIPDYNSRELNPLKINRLIPVNGLLRLNPAYTDVSISPLDYYDTITNCILKDNEIFNSNDIVTIYCYDYYCTENRLPDDWLRVRDTISITRDDILGICTGIRNIDNKWVLGLVIYTRPTVSRLDIYNDYLQSYLSLDTNNRIESLLIFNNDSITVNKADYATRNIVRNEILTNLLSKDVFSIIDYTRLNDFSINDWIRVI